MSRWPTKFLPQLCRPRQWPTLAKKNLYPRGYPVYGANGKIGFAETYTHEHPTILIGCRGSCGTIHVTEPKSYANGNAMALDDLDTSQVLLPWAVYFFRYRGFADIITGTSQPQLTQQGLARVEVPTPPLPEQERLVGLLDQADTLRSLRSQSEQLTASITPAIFQGMCTNAAFTQKTIGQLLEDGWLVLHKDGNHGSLYPRASDFREEGIPFLSATCITENGTVDHSEVKRLSEEKAKQLRHGWIERGDVLLAHNATVGKVGFYEGDYDRALIGTSLTAFRVSPERIDPRFLWAALRDEYFQHQLKRIMTQALRNQVPITAQRRLLLRLPPLAVQRHFAAMANQTRTLTDNEFMSRNELDSLFQSLLHQAFAGEL